MRKIFSLLYDFLIVVVLFYIISLGCLPDDILFWFIFIVLGITILLNILFLKFKNVFGNILIIVIMILIMICSLLGLYFIDSTISFVTDVSSSGEEISNYYVVVLQDSKYESFEELIGSDVGYASNVSEKVFTSLDGKLNYNGYSNQLKMYNDLRSGVIEAIIVNAGSMEIMDAEVLSFSDSVRILKEIDVKQKVEKVNNDIRTDEEAFTVYISGIDTYGDIGTVSRSDVNILVTVNPNTGKILLTSIPRDYYVRLYGTNGYKDKLTHSGLYGINTSIYTIEDLLDIDINYYVRVNFNTLIKVIDEIGGVEIYSDTSFIAWTDTGCKFNYGVNNVNGRCALAFARERYAYENGDRHRGENQKQVIKAIIDKVSSDGSILFKYNNLLASLSGTFQTNMELKDISRLVKNQIENDVNWSVTSISLDGYDSFNYTYSYSGSKLYVMEPNYATISKAKEKIVEVSSEK